MTPPGTTTTTPAFKLQAVLSFGVSCTAMGLGIAYLPVDAWMRAFLAIGLLYVITSAFTLAKILRDEQEASSLARWSDQARVESLVAERDRFAVPAA